MKVKYSMCAALSLVVSLLFSCTTLDPDWHMRYVKIYSAQGFNIKNYRLAIGPFKCQIPEIGQMVSDSVVGNLLNSGFTIIENCETSADYLLTANIVIAGGVARKVRVEPVGKSYIASATCKIINPNSKKIVKTVIFGKAVNLHDAVELGEVLAKGIKREQ